jgi:hypothetical protein
MLTSIRVSCRQQVYFTTESGDTSDDPLQLSGSMRLDSQGRPPWKPLTVTLITFFLPLGGTVLTIRNLERMGQLDRNGARWLTIAGASICALGMTTLITAAELNAHGQVSFDPNAATVLSVGLAAAAFAAQRRPYQKWRISHPVGAAENWMRGVGLSIVYTLLVAAIALPLQIAMLGALAALGQKVM